MYTLAYPRQTVLVTSSYRGKDNIITIDWHMPTSFEPFLYAISIGKTRFSYQLIKKGKEFVVNFMPFELKEKVLFCGRHSGRNIDKFSATELEKERAKFVSTPIIKQCCAFLECNVIKEIESGDHVIFIGKVLHSGLKNKKKRIFHLGGDVFTTIVD